MKFRTLDRSGSLLDQSLICVEVTIDSDSCSVRCFKSPGRGTDCGDSGSGNLLSVSACLTEVQVDIEENIDIHLKSVPNIVSSRMPCRHLLDSSKRNFNSL